VWVLGCACAWTYSLSAITHAFSQQATEELEGSALVESRDLLTAACNEFVAAHALHRHTSQLQHFETALKQFEKVVYERGLAHLQQAVRSSCFCHPAVCVCLCVCGRVRVFVFMCERGCVWEREGENVRAHMCVRKCICMSLCLWYLSFTIAHLCAHVCSCSFFSRSWSRMRSFSPSRARTLSLLY